MICVYICVHTLCAHMAISHLLAQPMLLGNGKRIFNSLSDSYGLEILFSILLTSMENKGSRDQNWLLFNFN